MKNWILRAMLLGTFVAAGCGSSAASSATNTGGDTAAATDTGGGSDATPTAKDTTTSGGADTTSSSGKIASGKDYSLIYAYNCGANGSGAEGSSFTDLVMDAAGQLTAYTATSMQGVVLTDSKGKPTDSRTTGTCTVSETGNNGEVAWGRWQGGTTGGNGQQPILTCSASDGMHYGISKHNTSMPTTTVTYEMIGATLPTQQGAAAAGKVTSAALVVDYAAKKFGIDIGIEIDGTAYKISSKGGAADVGSSTVVFGSTAASALIGSTPEGWALRALWGGATGTSIVVTYKGYDKTTYKYFTGAVAFKAK